MSDIPALSLISSNSELSLPSEISQQLNSPEDYENAFQQVTEQKNTFIWWEADLIFDYWKKYLKPLDVYRAGQLLSSNTVKYYLRTAAGFPPHTRIPAISFSHHYQATFADEWDSRTIEFKGERRFLYAENASDEGWSVRKLKEKMQDDEEKRAKNIEDFECAFCSDTKEQVFKYSTYRFGTPKMAPQKFYAHQSCLDTMMKRMIY